MTDAIPEGGARTVCLSDEAVADDRVAAREIHAAIKASRAGFVMLPRGMSAYVVRCVSGLLRTDPVTKLWGRRPEFSFLGDAPDTVDVRNDLSAVRSPDQWQRIREYLRHSDTPDDHPVAEAIADQLAAIDQTAYAALIVLSEPRDWLKRVERAEAALRASWT